MVAKQGWTLPVQWGRVRQTMRKSVLPSTSSPSHQRKFFRIGFASWLSTCLAACVLWVTTGCDSKSTSVDSIGDQASVNRGGEDGADSDSIDQGRPDAAGGSEPEFNREAALTAADRLLRSGQTEKAILELQRVLVSDPKIQVLSPGMRR